MTYDFDLITLGAGSGGVAASRRAALHGAKVAVVEGSRVGGTCVIRGCVPKKLLMYAAQFGDAMREARGYGWVVSEPHFNMATWAQAKAAETARLEGVYRQMLQGSGVTLIEVYGGGYEFEDLYQLAEQMMTWDERVILWRFHHLKVVERIIGGSVIGTQGTPVEVLGKRIDVRFFPNLWTVRDEITRRSPLGADGHSNR